MRAMIAIVAGLALLAGCASPRERCVAAATSELRTIDALIAETEGNIARGYALVREPRVRPGLRPCPPDDTWLFCPVDEVTVVERPVAIDRDAERRKLATLQARRAELLPGTQARMNACVAAHPAG